MAEHQTIGSQDKNDISHVEEKDTVAVDNTQKDLEDVARLEAVSFEYTKVEEKK